MLRTFVGKLAVMAAWTTALAVVATFTTVAPAGSASAEEGQAEEGQADLARGESLFALCTQCHGPAGGGNRAALAPAIAGLPQWYVESQLRKFRDGIRGLHPDDTGGLRMYPMSQWLREDADLTAVAAYVASLPDAEPEDVLEPGDAAKGEGHYAVCTACHGPQGKGNKAMGAPPLVGMDDWYLASSLRKYQAKIRGSDPRDSLGAAMIGMAKQLGKEQAILEQAILDVIAYIETLETE